MEALTISEALGGSKILRKAITSHTGLAELVREGLPAGSVAALAFKLHIASGSLAKTLSIPHRTLTRRVSGDARLTSAESARTVRLARVYTHAVEMIRFALYGMFEPVATLVVVGSTVAFFLLAVHGYDPQRGMLRRSVQPA